MHSLVGQLVLLTCPTDRLTLPITAGLRRVAMQRNAQLREMVAEGRGGTAPPSSAGGGSLRLRPAPLMLLDIDALTRRLLDGLKIGRQDFHYQCYLQVFDRMSRGEQHAASAISYLVCF